MPCYDPETHDRPIRMEQKIHRLTAMLCYLCGELERANSALLTDTSDLASWWVAHKAHDERIAALKEKRRLQGLDALTPTERGALFLGDDVSFDP